MAIQDDYKDSKSASGPAFHKSVAKVRVTRTGPSHPVGLAPAVKTTEFKGKGFDSEGEVFDVGSLGWNADDVATADADPGLVVERLDKDGKLLKKDGRPYPSVRDFNAKPLPGGGMREN